MTKVKVNLDGYNNKRIKIIQNINSGGLSTLEEVGRSAQRFAQWRAPKYTGKTAGLIKLYMPKEPGRITFRLVSLNPTGNDGHTRGKKSARYYTNGKFNLVRWMHTSPYAKIHIKSGIPNYMDLTRDYINLVLRRNAKGRFRSILTKFK